MLPFILRRVLIMIPTLLVVSIMSFIIIELPPGDYIDAYVERITANMGTVDSTEIEALRYRYGLDQPWVVRFWRWFSGVLQGDLGRSMQWNQPVTKLIGERLPWTLMVSVTSLLIVYIVSIPIGIYSATHQYSPGDYVATLLGFVGLATPNFLLALIFLWFYFLWTGRVAVGLFSDKYIDAAWSFARLVDLLSHIWLPAVLIGASGCAGLIRIMRANLLDELQKPYVMVARSKGLKEGRILFKYPLRIAMNPVVSTIGWTLPALINGELLVSMVLGLPTMAPLFVKALMSQDMFLAGSVVFILSSLTLIGTLLSDIALAWLDPRLRGAI